MTKPDYYPGDVVLIRSYGPDEGLSRKLEGMEGVIVKNLGAELRAKGSKVSSAYYRVYIPELDSERSVKGHFLELVKENPDREEAERLRSRYLEEARG